MQNVLKFEGINFSCKSIRKLAFMDIGVKELIIDQVDDTRMKTEVRQKLRRSPDNDFVLRLVTCHSN